MFPRDSSMLIENVELSNVLIIKLNNILFFFKLFDNVAKIVGES